MQRTRFLNSGPEGPITHQDTKNFIVKSVADLRSAALAIAIAAMDASAAHQYGDHDDPRLSDSESEDPRTALDATQQAMTASTPRASAGLTPHQRKKRARNGNPINDSPCPAPTTLPSGKASKVIDLTSVAEPHSTAPQGLQESFHAPQAATRPTKASSEFYDQMAEARRKNQDREEVMTMVARALDSIPTALPPRQREMADEVVTGIFTHLRTTMFAQEVLGEPISVSPPTTLESQASKPGRLATAGTTQTPTWAATATSFPTTSRASTKSVTFSDESTSSKSAKTNKTNKSTGTDGSDKSKGPPPDIRVLVRVYEERLDWARRQPTFALRKAAAEKLKIPLADIPEIHHIPSGFAIRPRTREIQLLILSDKAQSELGGLFGAKAFDTHQKWYNYVVPRCPREVPQLSLSEATLQPIPAVEVAAEEAEAQTGRQPKRVACSTKGPTEAGFVTLIVSFTEKVRPFKLFGSSAMARLIDKAPAVHRHDPGCQGWHSGRNCARDPRCTTCGEMTHEGPCQRPPKCVNCHAPQPADHEGCPAKPVRKNGKMVHPTKKQRASFRSAGEQLYRAAHPELFGDRTLETARLATRAEAPTAPITPKGSRVTAHETNNGCPEGRTPTPTQPTILVSGSPPKDQEGDIDLTDLPESPTKALAEI